MSREKALPQPGLRKGAELRNRVWEREGWTRGGVTVIPQPWECRGRGWGQVTRCVRQKELGANSRVGQGGGRAVRSVTLCSADGSRAWHRWGHGVDGRLWAAVEARALTHGDGGEGIVHVMRMAVIAVTVPACLRGCLGVQVEREAAERSAGTPAQ